MSESLLSVRDLKTWFGSGESTARAVDGISFDIIVISTVMLTLFAGHLSQITIWAIGSSRGLVLAE